MPTKNDYKPTLVLFMNYTFGEGQVIYTTESDITDNELLQITPDHVAKYLKYRAYGTAEPGDDAQPSMDLLLSECCCWSFHSTSS